MENLPTENPYAPTHPEIRDAIRQLCLKFDGAYWRALDRERAYPTDFVKALTDAGWLATLIPEEYGGAGLGISAAAAVLEEVQRAGCNGPDDGPGADQEAYRRAVGVPGRYARDAGQGAHHPAHPHHDESQRRRGVLRQYGGAGRGPDRRGRAGLPLHPGRHERRARADRR